MRVTMQASMTRIRHPRSEHHSVIRSCEDDLRPQLPRNTESLQKCSLACLPETLCFSQRTAERGSCTPAGCTMSSFVHLCLTPSTGRYMILLRAISLQLQCRHGDAKDALTITDIAHWTYTLKIGHTMQQGEANGLSKKSMIMKWLGSHMGCFAGEMHVHCRTEAVAIRASS